MHLLITGHFTLVKIRYSSIYILIHSKSIICLTLCFVHKCVSHQLIFLCFSMFSHSFQQSFSSSLTPASFVVTFFVCLVVVFSFSLTYTMFTDQMMGFICYLGIFLLVYGIISDYQISLKFL